MKIKFLFLFLAFSIVVKAQYTFITDRRFFDPTDLLGYDFKPGAMEVPDEYKNDIDPGEYSFGITANNLYVNGEGIKGVYSINNIQPEDFGFKLLLMNARDARLQGHLKIILNKYSMVEALIFKRSPKDKEIIFYQLPITKTLKERERDYFTDRGELVFENIDSIWGQQIHPFLVVHQKEKVQQRLQVGDSTYISFTEEVIIEEKEIKRKKSEKKDQSEVAEADTVEVLEADILTADPDSLLMDAPEVKVKITRNYYVTVKSLVKYDDGTRELKEEKYLVKKIDEKEDTAAGMFEERYLWEFVNDQKENIFLYLNGDRTVSTMEVGDKKYLMRGF